ncbi:nuclease-related domain-containing DEAD/DEAH box helicase [Telluribacter sp.]|jgi:ATP:corrinoid adenosyltransferase|uniref:nuclease-related domain-containing DEAD/DEAH box helicase n=1 Tax=Telluribacter sp. TaxID=1978767 RepID=UPI002E123279|nr:DEAD/DEAH box helicase family protein [Telluribacter sp.]
MPISPSSLNGYDFNSHAEKEIYLAATESKYFNNSDKYLFHSLNMSKTGDKRVKGEIDFVYLDSECILFMEVKGGEIKYDSLSNQWYVMGGTEKGDPFKQAYDSLFQTRDGLLPGLFERRFVSKRLVFGIGVLFPDCLKPDEFRKSTKDQMEYDPELIFDYTDKKVNDGFIKYIEKLKLYWSSHPQFRNRTGISSLELSSISKFFRKDLHFRLPVSDLISKSDKETSRLTSMQMFALDNLKYNEGRGGIIMGGPGTGKTLLALELLKRKVTSGKRTLFVCFNKNLAEYLNTQAVNHISDEGMFEIKHLHGIYRDNSYVHDSVGPVQNGEDYWSQELPLLFVRKLADSKKQSFDYLILDEGQDILNEYHFDALDELLKGGLNSGNWALFMDKEFQNIYNRDADSYFEYLREVYPCFVNVLQINCRNTLSTIQRASVQTGFPQMPCLKTDQFWKSEIRFYKSEIDLLNRINSIISNKEEEGIQRKDITVLCFEKRQIEALIRSNPNLYFEGAFSNVKKVNISTIHSYKGLENRFIIICGPADYNIHDKVQMSLIYIANTRATAQSIFFINTFFQPVFEDRINSLI